MVDPQHASFHAIHFHPKIARPERLAQYHDAGSAGSKVETRGIFSEPVADGRADLPLPWGAPDARQQFEISTHHCRKRTAIAGLYFFDQVIGLIVDVDLI